MMGIDVNRTISFTFLVAGALAGAAGVIFTLYGTTIQFNTGFTLGLIAFTAAVLGGIGNLPGAVLGGLLIGFIQDYNEGLSWHAPGSAWTNSIVFGILILILVFRPQGPARRADAGGRLDGPPTARQSPLQGRLPSPRGDRLEERAGALGEPVAVSPTRGPAARDRGARDPRDAARSAPRTRRRSSCSRSSTRSTSCRGRWRRWALPVDHPRVRGRIPAPHSADELPALPVRGSDLQQLPEHRHDGGDGHLRDDGRRPEHGRRLRGPPRSRLRRVLRARRVHGGMARLAARVAVHARAGSRSTSTSAASA